MPRRAGKAEEAKPTSMAELLRFALPALGISLSGPILSNIDNAFVGRLTGPEGLAALSPGTVVADYMLYLLVFLPRATVGLVSRAFASGGAKAAQPELQRALSVAMPIGVALSVVYLTCTESILKMLHVAPNLIPYAATYARVRGAVTWAALSQTVCLSALLATKDSWTPLKVVGVAAVANCFGDFALCVWPFRLGVGGAAAATSIATLLSFALMVRALRAKELLPKKWFRLPSSARYLAPLMEYAGPLLIVVATRMVSLSAMALSAAALGTTALAGYQILINLFTLFALVGEPLSQAAQALLPPLLEKKDTAGARRATKSLLFLGLSAGAVAGAGSFACAAFGGGTFSGDSAVIDVVHRSAPVLMFAVASLVFAYPVDGAMLATKNFRVLIALSIFGLVAQLPALQLITRSFSGTRQPALPLKLLMMTMFVRLLTLSLFSLARLWADLQVKPVTDGEERQ